MRCIRRSWGIWQMKSQLSQPFLIGEVLQPSDHFCGPPLDLLQQVHVFLVLRTPELNAVLQVRSHQSRVEGQNHLSRPAGHASPDAAQDTVGPLGCQRTFWAASAHKELNSIWTRFVHTVSFTGLSSITYITNHTPGIFFFSAFT